jgi:hypothetical protein
MALPTVRLPDTPRPASFTIQKTQRILTSEPMSGKHRMQTRVIGEPFHSVALKYNPIHRDDFGPLTAFLNGLRGQHDTFGLILPNFTKDDTGLIPGNYLTTSEGIVRQVVNPGVAPNTEIFYASSKAGNNTYSNEISVTSGEPIAVYFDASGVPGNTVVELSSDNGVTHGFSSSDTFVATEGRNVHMLTPNVTGTAYLRIGSGVPVVTDYSIKECFLVSSYNASFAPALQTAHDSQYILPLPAAVMNVSLGAPVTKVQYAKDSTIKIELDLLERRL